MISYYITEYIVFLIEVCESFNSRGYFDQELVSDILSHIDNIDVDYIHILLTIVNEKERLLLSRLLYPKIPSLTLNQLNSILLCYPIEKHKFYIFKLLIKKCIINCNSNIILDHFTNEKVKHLIDKIMKNLGTNVDLCNLLIKVGSQIPENQMSILEESIINSGVRLNNVDDYHLLLNDIFTENYTESCEILGINPDLIKN